MVQLDDQDRPIKVDKATEESHSDGDDAVRLAGRLCRDERFQRWLYSLRYAESPCETDATSALRDMLKIGSRAELAENAAARNEFNLIYEAYLRAK